ncbi:MAG: hypothetical protein ACFFC3_11340, partial [Candidatus Odinarchaeota archaeon]
LFDKIFDFISGYNFGFLTFIIGFTGIILGLLISGLVGDYIFWEQSISILGRRTGGIFSRAGIILSNFLAIPFIVYLGRILRNENVNDILRKLTIGCGTLASISAALTGIFSGVNKFITNLHNFFALLTWIGGAIACTFFGYLMFKNFKFSKSIKYFNLLIAGVFISYLIPFFIENFCYSYQNICYTLGRIISTIIPTYEWVVFFSILFWYLINAYYLFHKSI